jgi:hypothetical protein
MTFWYREYQYGYKGRLWTTYGIVEIKVEAMNAKSPFKIEYNQSLENVIKSFLKYRNIHLSD